MGYVMMFPLLAMLLVGCTLAQEKLTASKVITGDSSSIAKQPGIVKIDLKEEVSDSPERISVLVKTDQERKQEADLSSTKASVERVEAAIRREEMINRQKLIKESTDAGEYEKEKPVKVVEKPFPQKMTCDDCQQKCLVPDNLLETKKTKQKKPKTKKPKKRGARKNKKKKLPKCGCHDGFVLQKDGKSCGDIDECSQHIATADSQRKPLPRACSQLCENTYGSYECGCKTGYTLMDDGKTCEDVNECEYENGGCDHICNNKDGSYQCSCEDGFQLGRDGFMCEDIDECRSDVTCDGRSCANAEGGFVCESCPLGTRVNDIKSQTCSALEVKFNISEAKWSQWLNRDRASGDCDCEDRRSYENANMMPCKNPVAIECRTVGTNIPSTKTGQIFTATSNCSVEGGLSCFNKMQKDGSQCLDYEVRYLCPAESPGSNTCSFTDPSNHFSAEQKQDLCLLHAVWERKRLSSSVVFNNAQMQWIKDLIAKVTKPNIARRKRSGAVRKEYRQLTDAERNDYHASVIGLKNKLVGGASAYFTLVDLHRASNALGAHVGAGFLPWHRIYLKMYEAALQEIDPNVCLPYWDSPVDEVLPKAKDSVMWSDAFMGDGKGNVGSGPFSGWDDGDGGKLNRNIDPFFSWSAQLYSRADIDYIMTKSQFQDLVWCIDARFEGDHGGVHMWVGGDMSDIAISPSDPQFWQHHCFIDCVWQEFREERQGASRYTDYPPASTGWCFSGHHEKNNVMEPFGPPLTNFDALGASHEPTCSVRPSKIFCTDDGDCGGPYLFCHDNRCKSKIVKGGKCTGLSGTNACHNSICNGAKCVECISNADCAPNEFCNIFKNCKPKRNIGGWCWADDQCLSGHCDGFRCGECKTNAHCPPDKPFCKNSFWPFTVNRCTDCQNDAQCGPTQYCRFLFNPFVLNVCTPKKPLSQGCNRDAQCLSGHCHMFRCGECDNHSDCPPTEYCKYRFFLGKTTECEAKKPNGAICFNDAVCASGHCHLGRCGDCDNDFDCPSGRYCKNMLLPGAVTVCTPAHGLGHICVRDRMCTSTHCHLGRCGECDNHSDCPSNQYCKHRLIPGAVTDCVNKKGIGSVCLSAAVCASGICHLGFCSECTSNSQCQNWQYCDGGLVRICKNKKPFGSWCLHSYQCQSGICHIGKCSNCNSDSNCPSSQYCKYLFTPGWANYCANDLYTGWCNRGAMCQSGTCRPWARCKKP